MTAKGPSDDKVKRLDTPNNRGISLLAILGEFLSVMVDECHGRLETKDDGTTNGGVQKAARLVPEHHTVARGNLR